MAPHGGVVVIIYISEVKRWATKIEQSLVNSRIDFFYYTFRNVLLVSIPLLVVSGVVLSHLSFNSSATGSSSGTDSLTISISSACTLSSVVNTEHNTNINAGTYKDNIGKTTIKTTCNDNNGYSIYANGYSNNEEGNNKLINTSSPSNVIETGLNTSGDISAWAMKLRLNRQNVLLLVLTKPQEKGPQLPKASGPFSCYSCN